MSSRFKHDSDELAAALASPAMAQFHQQIEQVGQQFMEAFDDGHTVYVAGNGGSAAEAQHLSDEMVGRFKVNRPAYPVVALTADGAVLTCIGNDYGFENVFSRQLEALGKEGDIFVALSTSGNSANILKACRTAQDRGMTVIALTGPTGTLKKIADYAIVSPAKSTARIQELHLHAIHLLCTVFEPATFGSASKPHDA